MSSAMKSDIGRYGIIPEWLLDSGVSATAIRLFAVLTVKYADREGVAYPGRKRLATDMGDISVDTIDRAVRELRDAGALEVEHRTGADGALTSNLYHIRFVRLGDRTDAAFHGRTNVATSPDGCGINQIQLTRPSFTRSHLTVRAHAPQGSGLKSSQSGR